MKQVDHTYCTAVLDGIQDAVIAIDRDGRIVLFNRAAERLTNLRRAEALGQEAAGLIPGSQLQRVLATGEPELQRLQDLGMRQIITNRMPIVGEDGGLLGAFAVFRDETDLNALTSEVSNLQQMQVLLQAIISSTQDAISVVDAQGLGLLINPAYTRLTGLQATDVIGKPADVDIAEGESVHLRVLQTHEPVRNTKMKVGPMRRDVIVNVAPFFVDGEIRGSVGVIHDVSEMRQLTEELAKARERIRRLEAKYSFADIVGLSASMTAAKEAAERAAATPVTVLLRGESGCGKELFAHAIHHASDRRAHQFVRVNCAAIAESLLESELFGYDEGAFSGARKGGKKGLFEEANHGTLFLDEIAELSASTQAKLLRVLQEREIVRVGSTQAIAVDVRVIAATHVNLERAIVERAFREDLYYRLNVMPIVIPPLRYREEDLEPLAQRLIAKFNHEYGRNVSSLSPSALRRLRDYHWPGNVRELENVIGRAMIRLSYQASQIPAEHIDLPDDSATPVATASPSASADRPRVQSAEPARGDDLRGLAAAALASPLVSTERLDEIVANAERQGLVSALAATGGNRTAAARRLGISIRTLYYKLERHGLEQS